MQIVNEVLKEIKPTKHEEQELKEIIDGIVRKINKNLRNAKAYLGGSGAKKTWLKDAHDADIFVLYNYAQYKSKSGQLSDLLEKHLKKSFRKIIRIHGSRDYFQIAVKKYTFEIVPILHISRAEQALNITDISPLHTKWVQKHKKYVDGILLTKKFCKAAKVYGAESYIQGFSGYVCEILAIYYKSFYSLVKAAAKWQDKVIIDIEKHHKNVELEVNKSKLESPLVVIDPVQAGRNAAAAVSKEKFDIFRERCKQFLKKPSKELFIEKKIEIGELKKKHKDNMVIIEVIPYTGKRDVVGSKLLKAFEFLRNSLIEYGFHLKEAKWEWDKGKKSFFCFIFKNMTLPKTYEWQGPPLKAKIHVKKFKEKHKKTFIKNKNIYAIVSRETISARAYLKKFLGHDYFKDKIKKVLKIG